MKKVFSFLAVAVLIMSCASEQPHEEVETNITKAVSVIHAINDSDVSGVAYFEQVEKGVRVRAEVTGLSGQKHGFHIHTFGDCTANDGTSAGGHFNPSGTDHAGPEDMSRHMGDMGNISADEEGKASLEYVDSSINIDEIIGRGIIVHAGEDDLVSQPSGAAGPRIGCGVIGIQN